MKFTQKYENVLHMIQGICLALDNPNPYPNPTLTQQGASRDDYRGVMEVVVMGAVCCMHVEIRQQAVYVGRGKRA